MTTDILTECGLPGVHSQQHAKQFSRNFISIKLSNQGNSVLDTDFRAKIITYERIQKEMQKGHNLAINKVASLRFCPLLDCRAMSDEEVLV